ncbi:MAG: AAA family ATPase [Atopobiaceae bacterium]|jgi:ATP-dependent DNA helicase RecG|nr:AAA family ATPase [Atopobiaceae bacterium]MCI2050544.1 AAA family ATPase [Atopobiaceae bacterium]
MAVLFGVDDDGNAIGIGNAKEACLSIENKINDSLSPVPDYSLSVNDRTGVITLTVREGLSKPYLYRAKVYHRSDTASIEVDQLELRRLVFEGQNLTFDALPSRESRLSFSLLESRMQNVLGVETLSDDILRTPELTDDKGSYTVAGELLAGANGFPGVGIARFGDSISIFLGREMLTRCSILGQYDAALALFGKYYKYEKVEGSTRNTYGLVPESAFHEALANALAYRTWDVDANVRVAMYRDRVEITSPGGLPSGISVQEYLDGQVSKLRNPILGNAFFRLHLIERFGTGIPRTRKACRIFERQPKFEVYENSIRVTLPLASRELPISEDERKVYRELVGKSFQMSELTQATGFGRTKVLSILKALIDKGYASVSGTGRGTRYSAPR